MLTICTSRTTAHKMQVAILCPAYTAVPVDRDILWLSGNAQVPRYGSCKPAGTSHSYDLITGNSSAGTQLRWK